jgi:hypothetical protein
MLSVILEEVTPTAYDDLIRHYKETFNEKLSVGAERCLEETA